MANSINNNGNVVSSLSNLSSIWAEFKSSRSWNFEGGEFPQCHLAEGHLIEWCNANDQPLDLFTRIIPTSKCIVESFEDSDTKEVYKAIRLDAPNFDSDHAFVKHFRALAQNCLSEAGVPFIVLGRSYLSGTYTDSEGVEHDAQHFEPIAFYKIEGNRLPFTFYDVDGEMLKPYKGLELVILRKEDKMSYEEVLDFMRKLHEEQSSESQS